MREGRPSLTAQRVALHRRTFDRVPTSFGDAEADDALAADVAQGGEAAGTQTGEWMVEYLRGRTTFFDRVVVNALDRGVRQVVSVGAGYDGRSLRYAKPGAQWFEVDHPETQIDKLARLDRLGIDHESTTFIAADLTEPGLARRLIARGYEPGAPALLTCEGVIVYLDLPTVELLFDELRAIVTTGTRFAFSSSAHASVAPSPDRRQRFEAAVAAAGEPARNRLSPDDLERLLTATRWRAVELAERATHAGFRVAAPDCSTAFPGRSRARHGSPRSLPS
jgi:methyltransferase (TIGR00027 family)